MQNISFTSLAGALCLLSSLASAQEPDSQSVSDAVSAGANPIEEITVVGQRSFLTLYNQLETAKIELYSLYNDLNTDDDYDVECKKSNWTHTHIQRLECWPKFITNTMAENAQDTFRGIASAYNAPVNQIEAQYTAELDDLRANILRIAQEHPEVAAWLLELGRVEQSIARKQEECEKDPAFRFLFFRLCRLN